MAHVKKNDEVVVLCGKQAGKRGKVLEVDDKAHRVTVDGVNIVKRHMKARPPRFPQGSIVEKALPIHISNVMLVCPKCGKPTRPAFVFDADKTKHRACRKCKEQF
ncbi:MAG: 50S ribosomal protein L24 [bacterium]|jgi:large subunit ribosomal protein L24|nr:50S ribosomal protein L24 [bacterium]